MVCAPITDQHRLIQLFFFLCSSLQLQYFEVGQNPLPLLPSGLTGSAATLAYVKMPQAALTVLPNFLSSLTNLVHLELTQNPMTGIDHLQLTGFSWLTELMLGSCAFNQSLPAGLLRGATLLQTLDLSSSGFFGALSSDFFSPTPQLLTCDLSRNSFTGAVPSFQSLSQLQTLSLSTNAFTALNVSTFDGMVQLQSLDLSHNQISSILPNLVGCTSLALLDGSYNAFTGIAPLSWSTPGMSFVTITLSFNEINIAGSPIDVFPTIASLRTLRLDHNQLTVDPNDVDDIGATVGRLCSPTLTSLSIQNNQLLGTWYSGWSSTFNALQVLNISSQIGIVSLASDFFAAATLQIVDVSNNNIGQTFPDAFNGALLLTTLNAQGNPQLQMPSWVVPQSSQEYSSQSSDYFECRGFTATQNNQMVIRVDASSVLYAGCRCKAGTFGSVVMPAPTCKPIPALVSLQPLAGAPNVTVNSSAGTLWNQPLPPVTDAIYGSQALGFSTAWELDFTAARRDLRTSILSNLAGATVFSPKVGQTASSQPIRTLTLRLFVSRRFFASANDTLQLRDDASPAVQEVTGLDVAKVVGPIAPGASPITDPTFWVAYNASISRVVDPVMFEWQVFSNSATLGYSRPPSNLQNQSAAVSPVYFVATVSYSWDCPSSFLLVDAELGTQCLQQVASTYLPSRDDSYGYECLAWSTLSFPTLQALTNPADIGYAGCRCSSGTWGTPPSCAAVPVNVTVQPFAPPSMFGISFNITSMVPSSILDLSGQFNQSSATLSKRSLDVSTVQSDSLAPSLSDAWFGDRRFTTGLSTGWTIDLRGLRTGPAGTPGSQPIPGLNQSNSSPPEWLASPAPANEIPGDAALQPVRTISLQLHISLDQFKSSGNVLGVYEGDSTFAGARVLEVSSGDLADKCAATTPSAYVTSAAYQQRYAGVLADLTTPCVLEVVVLSNQASVSFVSRDAGGKHVVITYSYAFTCPDGLSLDDLNECSPPSLPASKVWIPIVIVVVLSFAALLVWLLVERLRAQRQAALIGREASANRVSTSLQNFEELSAQLVKRRLRDRQRKLQLELGIQTLLFVVDLLLVIFAWVTVGSIVDSTASSGSVSLPNVPLHHGDYLVVRRLLGQSALSMVIRKGGVGGTAAVDRVRATPRRQ